MCLAGTYFTNVQMPFLACARYLHLHLHTSALLHHRLHPHLRLHLLTFVSLPASDQDAFCTLMWVEVCQPSCMQGSADHYSA
jgi:hypothetical protein